MSSPILPHGQLPPIPEGCGILPIADNRSRGPHSTLLDLPPELATDSTEAVSEPPAENDALEQTYRRVLARALALAASALLLAALTAASLAHNAELHQSFLGAQLLFRVIAVSQLLFMSLCGKYVEKLSIAPAAILLFSYAAFCALELSVLLSPATLAVAFLCAAIMYAITAAWGFLRRTDLALPITAIFMMLGGGLILVAVNLLLQTQSFAWTLSSIIVVIFAGGAAYHAQQIRDFYQEYDDDNAEGWKASVLGALFLLINSVNLYFLVATFLSTTDDDDPTDALSH